MMRALEQAYEHFNVSRAHSPAMNRAIETNAMRPVIDQVFPFSDAVAAFRYYEAGEKFGKVVIQGA